MKPKKQILKFIPKRAKNNYANFEEEEEEGVTEQQNIIKSPEMYLHLNDNFL